MWLLITAVVTVLVLSIRTTNVAMMTIRLMRSVSIVSVVLFIISLMSSSGVHQELQAGTLLYKGPITPITTSFQLGLKPNFSVRCDVVQTTKDQTETTPKITTNKHSIVRSVTNDKGLVMFKAVIEKPGLSVEILSPVNEAGGVDNISIEFSGIEANNWSTKVERRLETLFKNIMHEKYLSGKNIHQGYNISYIDDGTLQLFKTVTNGKIDVKESIGHYEVLGETTINENVFIVFKVYYDLETNLKGEKLSVTVNGYILTHKVSGIASDYESITSIKLGDKQIFWGEEKASCEITGSQHFSKKTVDNTAGNNVTDASQTIPSSAVDNALGSYDDGILCNVALSRFRTHWNGDAFWRSYVVEAKRRGFTIATCRATLDPEASTRVATSSSPSLPILSEDSSSIETATQTPAENEQVSVRAVENPNGVAVIIGNKTYTHSDIPTVSFAHRDADAIKRYVIETLGYRERNIIDLRDATQAEIEGVFGNERSHKGDLWRYVRKGRSDVVVYYSGHGMPGLKDGRSYLLPSNIAPGRVEISGYPLDVLYDNLGKLEARSTLVLLDACFSGGSAGGTLVPAGSFAVVPKQVMPVPRGLTVITAAGPDEIASWDMESKHGLFTAHLLTALEGKADREGYGDDDGAVTLAEVKAYLDEEMTYQARRIYGREQTATVIGASDTVLATYTLDAVPEAPVPAAEAEASAIVREEAVELAYWQSIQDSADPEMFEAYLQQYPDGSFAPLARLKRDTLLRSAEAERKSAEAEALRQATEEEERKEAKRKAQEEIETALVTPAPDSFDGNWRGELTHHYLPYGASIKAVVKNNELFIELEANTNSKQIKSTITGKISKLGEVYTSAYIKSMNSQTIGTAALKIQFSGNQASGTLQLFQKTGEIILWRVSNP